MTDKEAIKYLKQLYPYGGHCWLDEQRIDAISIAVNAIEFKEKIRAEIESCKSDAEHFLKYKNNLEQGHIQKNLCDHLFSFIDSLASLQEEPAPKILEDMLNATPPAESLGISAEEHDKIIDQCLYGKEPEMVDIDDLPKEKPISEELEKAMQHNAPDNIGIDDLLYWRNGFITGAKWQKENLWKPADGDDLPEIDREVIALLDNDKVVFAHRPPEYWDGKDIITGKVTRNYVERYDKGLWNIPNVKYWLDVNLPKQED